MVDAKRRFAAFPALAIWWYAVAAAVTASSPEQQFLSAMHEAMIRMDKAMSAPPAGNIDADFVAMMVPHHQAAIDMAELQLRYGHSQRLARIAQEIIVEQQQEITAMRGALGESK